MNKKKFYLFLIILCSLCLLLFIAFNFNSPQNNNINKNNHEIRLTESGFIPQETTINKGETIKFSTELKTQFWPASDLHPTHGLYPEFDPQQPIEPNSTWSFKFEKTGTFRFHDHLQPFYRGTINVRP